MTVPFMRALIVEDTLINQEYLKMILSAWGECQVAESGEQAVAAFAGALDSTPFDVVFMDVMLPGMDGLQALERIRALEQARGIQPEKVVKTIITTAMDDETPVQNGIDDRAISYVAKPVRQETVEAALRQFGLID
jgi:two-component system chemotaxis response regulator CheY